MFSSEICEIFKNTYFIQYLRWLLLKLRMQKPQKKLIHVIYLRTTLILRKSRHWWNCNRISKKQTRVFNNGPRQLCHRQCLSDTVCLRKSGEVQTTTALLSRRHLALRMTQECMYSPTLCSR